MCLRNRIHENLESWRGHLPHSRPGHQILLCASGTHTRSRARERGLRPPLQSARMYRAHLRPPAPPVHTPAHIDPTCDAQQDRVLTHITIHTPNRRGSLSPLLHHPQVHARRSTSRARVFIATKGTTWSRRPHTSKTRCRTDMQQHSSAVSFGRSYQQTTATHGLFSHLACRAWGGCAQAPRLRLPAARRCEHSPS